MTDDEHQRRLSLGELRYLLTPRDMRVIQAIREWHYLTSGQIYGLFFAEHASYNSGIRACTRVLARLREHRLVYRLDRPVGGLGGGSRSTVWSIDVAGDRLLRADPDNRFSTRFRTFQPSPLFLAHTLAIGDVRVRLETMSRAGRFELVEALPEPTSWRPFTWMGRKQILKPDLYLDVALGDDEWMYYLEVDRATESIPALLKKVRIYEDYLATGSDESDLGVIPLVLWLVPSEKRATSFRSAIAKSSWVTADIHRIIVSDGLETELMSAISITTGSEPEKGGV